MPSFPPTTMPTFRPTTPTPTGTPTSQPSSTPTFVGNYTAVVEVGSDKYVYLNNLVVYQMSHHFTKLGNSRGNKFYLTIDVFKTSFQGSQSITNIIGDPSFGFLPLDSISFSPGPSCWTDTPSSPTIPCIALLDVTPYMDPGHGGSLLITTQSVGITGVGVGCQAYNGSVVRVRYTVQEHYFAPTPAPTISSVGKSGLSSITQLVQSGSTPFYFIFGFGGAYAFLAVLVVRFREGDKSIVQLPLLPVMVMMALLGSGFISEMYLVSFLIASQTFKNLGIIILLARFCHLPASE